MENELDPFEIVSLLKLFISMEMFQVRLPNTGNILPDTSEETPSNLATRLPAATIAHTFTI